MSTDTDNDIRALLDEIVTPEHRPGFWEVVHDDLDRHAHGDRPIRLDEVRVTRPGVRPWMLAAAALAILAGGIGVFLAAHDDGSSVDMITEPTEVPSPDTTEPPDDGALRPAGSPSLGTGQVVAVSPDGEWLYVADADPAGGMGCEGSPRETLFVQPADASADGERTLATDTPIDATGGTWLAFGPDGSVAVHTMCEMSRTGFGTGVVGEDGTIVDYAAVDGAEEFEAIVDFEWAQPGVLIMSTQDVRAREGDDSTARAGRRLFELDVATGEQTPVGPAGTMYVDVTADGRLVTRDNVGTVRFGDEVLGSEGRVHRLVVSDDGRFVVTAGDKGVTVYDRETGEQERIFEDPAFSLAYLESGDVVFSTRDDQPVARVMAVRLGTVGRGDSATSTLVSDAGLGRLTYVEVAPDGSRMWATYLDEREGDEVASILVAQPLTR